MPALDAIIRNILRHLRENARLSNAAHSRQLFDLQCAGELAQKIAAQVVTRAAIF